MMEKVTNWKTTLAGILPIIAAIYQIAQALVTGSPINLLETLGLLGAGGGLLVAKDHDVTGGTKQQ